MFRIPLNQLNSANRTRSLIEYWLLLLVSPLLVSLIANILFLTATDSKVPLWLWCLLITLIVIWIFCCLVVFTTVFHSFIIWWGRFRRRSRFFKPYVVVLDGRISDDGTASVKPLYTVHTPDEWLQEIRNHNPRWHVELVSVDRALLDNADMVINPFGEAYPEENLSLHATFVRFLDYVRRGGVYVNVAGYPFWWKTNPATGDRAQSGRFEQQTPTLLIIKPLLPDFLGISPTMNGTQSQLLPTHQEPLDIQRFGQISGAGGGIDALLFRTYPDTTPRMIPLLRSANNNDIIIGAVPYWDGFFIFAGLEINRTSHSFSKMLAAVRGWVKYETDGRH